MRLLFLNAMGSPSARAHRTMAALDGVFGSGGGYDVCGGDGELADRRASFIGDCGLNFVPEVGEAEVLLRASPAVAGARACDEATKARCRFRLGRLLCVVLPGSADCAAEHRFTPCDEAPRFPNARGARVSSVFFVSCATLCMILHKWRGENCNQILIDLDGNRAYTVLHTLVALGRVMARVRGRAAM